MAPYYPPPDTSNLLHPLLACLPMAFISTQPPPALYPILSPILRQRVKLLSETRTIAEGSWLPLLCWDFTDGAQLPAAIENISFEAHPVSGELEFGDIEPACYKRLDQETLQSRSVLTDLGLVVIYTWCMNDAEGGDDGWRISEFKKNEEDIDSDPNPWCATFSEADENWKLGSREMQSSVRSGPSLVNGNSNQTEAPEEEDDDAYWSQYDQRQSETPAHNLTPQPREATAGTQAKDEEQDYYSRYDSVQPEMDAEDPSAEKNSIGESTLHGNSLVAEHSHVALNETETDRIVHTRPSSSSSSVVAHLEQSAEHQSQAEVAIQHHISSSIKNLYRLSKAAGIERSDFQRIVSNELECLSLLDEE